MTFGEHLTELRSRLVKALLATLVTVGVATAFADDLMRFLMAPYHDVAEAINLNPALVATSPTMPVLTYFKVSLIVGFASAAFNAVASLPISRLVDRMSRRLIIGIGLLTIGTGSALTGLANSFWQLFAARLFSGIGGAGNGPATYSILADYFPPAKLPKAIAFMNFGFTSGNGIALLLGGTLIAALAQMGSLTLPLIGTVQPWQLVFLVMAIPDLLLGVLMLTTVYEPPRRGRALAAGAAHRAAPIRTARW